MNIGYGTSPLIRVQGTEYENEDHNIDAFRFQVAGQTICRCQVPHLCTDAPVRRGYVELVILS